MFSVDKYSNIMYRGVSLSSNHPAALDDPCYMLPEDQLNAIDGCPDDIIQCEKL